MMKKFKDLVTANGVFSDGDWVESKDQDPNGDVRLIQLADIGVGTFIDKSNRFMTSKKAEELKCTYLEEGDILIARMPDPIGRACIFPELNTKCVTVVDICIVRPASDEIDSRWLMHLINSERFNNQILKFVTGTTRQRISRGNLAKLDVEVPPLEKQKRIAAILDKADSVRRKRQQAIKLADDFLRSIFLDMFGDPISNPKGWEVKKWNNVLKIVNGKSQKAVIADDGKYPIMGSGGEMGRATEYLTPENSVIIGRKGNINKPILVKEKFWNVDTAFGLVPHKELISHNYLYWFCVFFNFEKLNKTVTIPSLTKADLLEIQIPVPDLALINKFDTVVKKLESTKALKTTSLFESNIAFSSLSQKAFAGGL
ncbi:restriction endonuclease subunit S [Thalassotalea marina]|uniref:Type I restriction modification DNA specificity domain-containing protein n=1 Tax=Thalassotalea marina TaxID=1673741 RepID=A0A919EM79_9GAMM|nr:restriction endonuclease subunit S [Thalassotalea marina]GHF97426.1 hypothetical protein GCM10017161_27000 [Thalassotalea marina]